MAIAKVADRASAANTTSQSATTLTIGTGGTAGTIPVGNVLIARIAADNSGASGAAPGLSVSGSAGNTWVVLTPALQDPGAASAGIATYICYTVVTNELTTGNTISFDWVSAVTAKAIVVEEWSGINTTTPVAVNPVTSVGSTSPAAIAINPTAAGQLVYMALGVEGSSSDTFTGDSDTTNGNWVLLTATGAGTTTSGAAIRGQYKIVTATGTQNWGPTFTARDRAAIGLVFAEEPPTIAKTGTTDPLNVSIPDQNATVVKATTQTLNPGAIVTQLNAVGAVTDIDEDPDSPDGAWVTTGAATPLITNIVPTPTSGLETLPAGWALRTSCSLAQETTLAHSGTKSLAQTKIAGGANMACQPANHIFGGSISIPVIAGNTYSAKVWCRAATVARTARFFLYWWDAAQVELTGTGVFGTNSTSAWTEYIIGSATAPAGAVESQLILQIDGAADGEKHLWDDLQLYENSHMVVRLSFPSPDTDLVPGFTQEFKIRMRPPL